MAKNRDIYRMWKDRASREKAGQYDFLAKALKRLYEKKGG